MIIAWPHESLKGGIPPQRLEIHLRVKLDAEAYPFGGSLSQKTHGGRAISSDGGDASIRNTEQSQVVQVQWIAAVKRVEQSTCLGPPLRDLERACVIQSSASSMASLRISCIAIDHRARCARVAVCTHFPRSSAAAIARAIPKSATTAWPAVFEISRPEHYCHAPSSELAFDGVGGAENRLKLLAQFGAHRDRCLVLMARPT